MEPEETLTAIPHSPAANSPMGPYPPPLTPMDAKAEPQDSPQYDEELLLKWDDHHKSFFELAEDLCHQELFIDVTLSCGEHNFPAHKLVLSVCSPYFRHLFLRNPCKHPIVVLKDVHFKYMKLLLMYMYRGEVSCPQEDLHGLLRTARSLQIRGLVELERKREAEGYLCNSMTGSPIKQVHPASAGPGAAGSGPIGSCLEMNDGASTTSCDLDSRGGDDFSIDEVRSRLHGQLEIQPVSRLTPQQTVASHHPLPPWFGRDGERKTPLTAPSTSGPKLAVATSSNDSEGAHSEDDQRHHSIPHQQVVPQLHHRIKREYSTNGNGHTNDNNGDRWIDGRGSESPANLSNRDSTNPPPSKSRSRPSSTLSSAAQAASNAALLAAAQAAGMPISSLDPADPMSSMNALLAAAQAHGNNGSTHPTSSYLPTSTASPGVTKSSLSSSRGGTNTSLTNQPSSGGNGGQGVDLSQAAAMANLQLYYYMQKVAAAGMGNPKERKECPICGKTLYDRSTWNRHMRIHTGEKPYPCRFCGRRFRTNYNKLGHEKKCPDRHARAMLPLPQNATPTGAGSVAADSPQASGPTSSTTPLATADFH